MWLGPSSAVVEEQFNVMLQSINAPNITCVYAKFKTRRLSNLSLMETLPIFQGAARRLSTESTCSCSSYIYRLKIGDFFFRVFNVYFFQDVVSKTSRWYRLRVFINIIIFKVPVGHKRGLCPPAEVRAIKAEVKSVVTIYSSDGVRVSTCSRAGALEKICILVIFT